MNQSQKNFETETNGNREGANNSTSVYPYPQKKLEGYFKTPHLINGEGGRINNFLKEAETIAFNSQCETKIGIVITQNNDIIFAHHVNGKGIFYPKSVGAYRGRSNPNYKCFIVKGKLKYLYTNTPTDQKLTKELITLDDLKKINIEYLFRKRIREIFTWQQSNIKVVEIKDLIKLT